MSSVELLRSLRVRNKLSGNALARSVLRVADHLAVTTVALPVSMTADSGRSARAKPHRGRMARVWADAANPTGPRTGERSDRRRPSRWHTVPTTCACRRSCVRMTTGAAALRAAAPLMRTMWGNCWSSPIRPTTPQACSSFTIHRPTSNVVTRRC